MVQESQNSPRPVKIRKRALDKYRYFFSLGRGIREPWLMKKPNLTSESGVSCFHSLESTGQESATKHPRLLDRLKRGKALCDLNVKMWAEDLAEGLLTKGELKSYGPDWVVNAAIKQSHKLR